MKPTAILSSDWHIRHTIPKCRTDDFENAMFTKLIFINDLAKKYDCPILIAGDLGDKPKWDEWVVKHFIAIFEGTDIISIAGQHDLINHRLDSLDHTTMGVLKEAKIITIPHKTLTTLEFNIDCFHYGEKIKKTKHNKNTIAMSHQMVIKNKQLWPGQKAPKAIQLLKKHPQYKLILTGDNHESFTEEYDGRLLVNPGCILRMTTEKINHKPRVYLWYKEENKVEPVYLPIEENVFDTSYIEEQENRDERIEAFVKSINDDYDVELSFENNIEKYFNKNRTRKRIKEKVKEAIQ